MKKKISEFILSDILIKYVLDDNNTIGLEAIPVDKRYKVKEGKNYEIDPLVQVSVRGDDFTGGFANGHTMRNGKSTLLLKYDQQFVEQNEDNLSIITVLKTDSGQAAKHILTFHSDCKAFEVRTIYRNESNQAISIEMLSSFSMGGITPFAEDEAVNSILVHRIRSCWSMEGRVETTTIEDLQLEPSWSRCGVRVEKFGQVGSMPVRKYFPFIAVEDRVNGVTWAAQIACASSWQMELYRRDEALCFSGGLADHDFGHWMKILEPNEQFETPVAYMTVGSGRLDEVSQRLLTLQKKSVEGKSNRDKLPVIFNEFCTTWGTPSHENIKKIIDIVKTKGLTYFVIDAGWYADKENGWSGTNGDWVVSSELFPEGLEETVRLIREAGLLPGIWFEFETCAPFSKMYKNEEHLLKRDGNVITSGSRRFLNMRDPWVEEYLTDKVIHMLKKFGFKYIKVDYNETIGVGCDGSESLGEGLRQNILASQAFFKKIRQEIPDIVIENCSSGGHRLEPSMMSLCDMASFSDAHECNEIPIIAANLHRVIKPCQSQVWAVLRKEDSIQRIVYSIANTFLGVMCLSGDIYDLSEEQWEHVDKGIKFYNRISHITTKGATQFFGSKIKSYRSPEGWQAIIRYSESGNEAYVVTHTFGGRLPSQIEIPIADDLTIQEIYSFNDSQTTLYNNILTIPANSEFEATAIYLSKSI